MSDFEPSPNHSPDQDSGDDKDKAPNILQVITSVLAAFFGVQSSKNKERDFKYGNHKVFIAVGIILTLVFLVTVITIVQLVLSNH